MDAMSPSPVPAPHGRPHDEELAALHRIVDEHPIWRCELLTAAGAGQLSLADYRFLFAQYFAYSRRFTRYLAAVMAACDDDHLRARLTSEGVRAFDARENPVGDVLHASAEHRPLRIGASRAACAFLSSGGSGLIRVPPNTGRLRPV